LGGLLKKGKKVETVRLKKRRPRKQEIRTHSFRKTYKKKEVKEKEQEKQ